MTVVVTAKIYEGLVVGADSTTSNLTPISVGSDKYIVSQTYDNVNKVVNICRGLPVGLATWGGGSIGTVSIAILAKDLREALINGTAPVSKLNKHSYSVESIAKSAKEFFWGKFKSANPDLSKSPKDTIGFLVFGLSANADHAEAWLFEIIGGTVIDPKVVFEKAEDGVKAFGQSEATSRLIAGFDERGLKDFFVTNKTYKITDPDKLITELKHSLGWKLHHPAMPIQDVIDLTRSLVRITADCSRFKFGPQTVGGPIDLAVVTKHEGFKWIQRKFFYDSNLNPEELRK